MFFNNLSYSKYLKRNNYNKVFRKIRILRVVVNIFGDEKIFEIFIKKCSHRKTIIFICKQCYKLQLFKVLNEIGIN